VSTSTQDAAAIVGATGLPAGVTAGALEDAGTGEAAGAAGFPAGFCATAGAENAAAATNSAQQSVDERMEGLPKAHHYTERPRAHRITKPVGERLMSRVVDEKRRIRAFSAMAPLAFAVVVLAMSAQSARAHDADEAALGSLVDAELAFARMGLARGVREAFLANFADDGIVFEPAPVKLREAWRARPTPADPLAIKLEWAPAQAGISRSHDMGYTTGPSTLTLPGQPPRHGVFFSVWQRNGTGPWRVVLDAGTSTPSAVDFAALGAAPRPQFKGRGRLSMERRKLLDREANRALGSRGFTPNGYARLVADDARLHRDDALPVATRSSVGKAAAASFTRVSWKPIDARVSAAADMAFTYGNYRETDRSGQVRDGYYAHLWLRDAQGTWQLAYDVVLPAPAR
jgi:hypothetical protein